MGFDLDRSDVGVSDGESLVQLMERLFEENLLAERAAIASYRRIADTAKPQDEAAIRLVRVVLAVEEEHAEILATMRDTLREMKSPAQ